MASSLPITQEDWRKTVAVEKNLRLPIESRKCGFSSVVAVERSLCSHPGTMQGNPSKTHCQVPTPSHLRLATTQHQQTMPDKLMQG